VCLGLVEVEKSRCNRCCWGWLGDSMCHEQSWMFLLLRLRDVGLGVSWLPIVLSPMASTTIVVAAVILCRLRFFGGAALDTSTGASLGAPRPRRLCVTCRACHACGQLLQKKKSPSSSCHLAWQPNYSWVRRSLVPEEGCGSSLSMTLR
jgi:hypothetical protein